MVGNGGRRKITQGLSERKRKAENDPLFQFIIDNFKEEVERDLERRESQPELPWGTSFRQQLMEAQEEEEFKALLGNLRNIYRNDKPARLGSIEIQSRSSLDRSHFLARYRSRRAIFYVSCVLKILFPYTRDTLNVSDEPRYCIGVGVADTYFLYRDQPCKPDTELKILAFVRRDRLQTERLAAKHPHLTVTSLAADEAHYTETDYADYLL